jgi:hypothetical protein
MVQDQGAAARAFAKRWTGSGDTEPGVARVLKQPRMMPELCTRAVHFFISFLVFTESYDPPAFGFP